MQGLRRARITKKILPCLSSLLTWSLFSNHPQAFGFVLPFKGIQIQDTVRKKWHRMNFKTQNLICLCFLTYTANSTKLGKERERNLLLKHAKVKSSEYHLSSPKSKIFYSEIFEFPFWIPQEIEQFQIFKISTILLEKTWTLIYVYPIIENVSFSIHWMTWIKFHAIPGCVGNLIFIIDCCCYEKPIFYPSSMSNML